MQKIKYFMKSIGVPNEALGVISAEDAEAELEYKYLNQGWSVSHTANLGAVKNSDGNEIGWKIFHVLVKEEVSAKAR